MIHNKFIEDLPRLLNGESVTVGSHYGFSSSTTFPTTDDTSLPSENGPRYAIETNLLDNNSITYSVIRPSTEPPAEGEDLYSCGLFNAATSGDMWLSALLSGIRHTPTFDFEVQQTVRFNRYG